MVIRVLAEQHQGGVDEGGQGEDAREDGPHQGGEGAHEVRVRRKGSGGIREASNRSRSGRYAGNVCKLFVQYFVYLEMEKSKKKTRKLPL